MKKILFIKRFWQPVSQIWHAKTIPTPLTLINVNNHSIQIKTIWNGSLYTLSSILVFPKWKILEPWTCRAHFSGRPYFTNLGSWNFWIPFRTLNDHFFNQNIANKFFDPPMLIYTVKASQQHKYHLDWTLHD
jgi:hypothetical protein